MQQTDKNIINFAGEMYSTNRPQNHFGLILPYSGSFLTKICAKNDLYIFVLSDLDLWPVDLKFAALVALFQWHMSALNYKFVQFSYFEKIGSTVWTDRRSATLNVAPYGEPHNNISSAVAVRC